MILDIMAFRNKKMKCYTNPYFIQEKLDNQEVNMMRALQQDPSLLARLLKPCRFINELLS